MADDSESIKKGIQDAVDITNILMELSKATTDLINPMNLVATSINILNRRDFKEILKNKKSYPYIKGDGSFTNEVIGDVALNVAVSHSYYVGPIKDRNGKISIFANTDYVRRLQDVVVEDCKLRQLLTPEQQLNGIGRTPLLFITRCLTEQLLSKLKGMAGSVQYFKKERQFVFSCFDKMLRTLKSLVTILVDEDYYNAYTLLRTLIEAFFVYLTLKDNSEGIKEYEKFLNYRIEYEQSDSKEYPKEFLDKFGKYKGIRGISKTNFLDYGWLNAIDPDNKLFTFESVYMHCQDEDFKKDDAWLRLYKFCNKFVHANLFGFRSTDDTLYAISSYVSQILLKIAVLFCDTFGEECKCDDIDLIHCLEQRLDEHKKILSFMPQFTKKNEK